MTTSQEPGGRADERSTLTSPQAVEQNLQRLVEEFLARQQAGEKPDATEYVLAHPSIASELEKRLHVVEFLGCVQHGKTASGDEVIPIRSQLGRYLIDGVLGSGASAVVYRAYDPKFQREVALKVMRRCDGEASNLINRFWRDARIAARLRHPNIVPVHDIGEIDGVRYIDMELIHGETLQDRLQRCEMDSFSFRAAADFIFKLATALQYAHDAGIVHRDIKPSNVIIDEHGEPQLTDFGLARSTADEESLTALGQIIGTPAYMSPEQAEGRGSSADHLSDVYSLGVVCYRLVTGRLPFPQSDSLVKLLANISGEEPVRPRTINPGIPRDLETICLKAMAKAPGDRFASARSFADELWRWLSDEPLTIRPPTQFARLRRWARRHRALTRVMLAASVLLVAVAAGSAWAVWDQREQRHQAELKSLEDQQKAVISRQLHQIEMDKRAELEAWALLRRARSRLGIPTHGRRSETYRILSQAWVKKNSLAASDVRQRLELETRSVFAASLQFTDIEIDETVIDLPRVYYQSWHAALHPNRDEIVIGTHLGPIHWERGKIVRPPDGLDASKPRPRPVFIPNGKHVVIDERDGGLTLWDDRAIQQIASYSPKENGAILDMGFSSSTLTVCHEDGTLRSMLLPNLIPVDEWRLEVKSPSAARFSSDGKAIAIGSDDGSMTIWSTEGRMLSRKLQTGRFAVTALAWSQDRQVVAVGTEDGAVQTWNASDGTRLLNMTTAWPSIGRLDFALGGHWLIAGGREGDMVVWDADSGRHVFSGPLIPNALSTTGQRFAGTSNRRIAFCNLIVPASVREFRAHRSTIDRIVWSRDCRRLATLDHSFELRVWDVESGQSVCRVSVPRGSYSSANSGIALNDNGSLVAFSNGGEWSKLELYDVATGQLLSPSRRLPDGIDRLVCAEGEKFILVREERSSTGWQSVLYTFDRSLSLGQARILRPAQAGESGFHASNLTDDGRYYCWVGPRVPASKMRLELYDVRTGDCVQSVPCPQEKKAESWGGAISAEGRFLWIQDNPLGGGKLFDLRAPGPPRRADAIPNVSRDQNWSVVSTPGDGAQGQLPSLLLTHQSGSRPWLQLGSSDLHGTGPGVFSPDGRHLAWLGEHGSISVADLPKLRAEVEAFEKTLGR